MSGDGKSGGIRAAYRVALVGILAATLSCSKFALSLLPNIEVVTLLTALYGYVFGVYGVAAAFVFVCVEPLIYGAGTWWISYLIYWPLVALVFAAFGKFGVKNRFLLTLSAAFLTFLFGVITSLADVGLFSGYWDDFGHRFAIMYIRGIRFFVTQIVCNVILFLFIFGFLVKRLSAMRQKILK